MITSAKNCTKNNNNNNKKMDRWNPRTNGKSKAIQRKSHTEAYTYTLRKRENICKRINRQRINIQNIQTAHAAL